MAQSPIAHPGHIEIERPPCSKCHGPMTLTGVVSGKDGVDIRTFECSLCNCSEKVTAASQFPYLRAQLRSLKSICRKSRRPLKGGVRQFPTICQRLINIDQLIGLQKS